LRERATGHYYDRFVIASSFYTSSRAESGLLGGRACWAMKNQVFELPENACFSESQELYGLL